MDDAYCVYMAILDKPGMNTNQIAKLFGKKYASSEDDRGGLYVFEG